MANKPSQTPGARSEFEFSKYQEDTMLEKPLLQSIERAKEVLGLLKQFEDIIEQPKSKETGNVMEEIQIKLRELLGKDMIDERIEEKRIKGAIYRGVQAVCVLMERGYYKKKDMTAWKTYDRILSDRFRGMSEDDERNITYLFDHLEVYIPSI